MTDKPTSKFDFDTGMPKGSFPLLHFTVRSECEKAGETPAELQMMIWADTPQKAAELFRKVGEHLGFKVTGELDVAESVSMSPPRKNASAYDVRFGGKVVSPS
ncbi:hypothetical protein [Parvularcula marina]|uniref:hypothetical protein n=1 Tax=Parvularcula marina TaxID=2292771 RepID=UPI003515BE4D